jgi:hypothetical protein
MVAALACLPILAACQPSPEGNRDFFLHTLGDFGKSIGASTAQVSFDGDTPLNAVVLVREAQRFGYEYADGVDVLEDCLPGRASYVLTTSPVSKRFLAFDVLDNCWVGSISVTAGATK